MKFKNQIFTILSLIPILFTQCNDIENDRRILVKGKVVDINNVPQQNLQVYTSIGGGILGEGVTNNVGEFEFTSLSSNSYLVNLVVELPDEFKFPLSSYETLITNFEISLNNLQDGRVNLQPIRILPFAEVKINFVRESEENLRYEIKRNFNRTLNGEFFSFWRQINLSEEVTPFRNLTSEGFLEQSTSFFSIHELVQKNEVIELTYQVNEQEEQNLLLPINQDYNEFEINF